MVDFIIITSWGGIFWVADGVIKQEEVVLHKVLLN